MSSTSLTKFARWVSIRLAWSPTRKKVDRRRLVVSQLHNNDSGGSFAALEEQTYGNGKFRWWFEGGTLYQRNAADRRASGSANHLLGGRGTYTEKLSGRHSDAK